MLSFSGSLKVFVAVEACDMRKGFNGLHALVSERLGEDLKGGALFVFSNHRLGFHWNQRRCVWQHPCGACAPFAAHPQDPRSKYGSYYAADLKPA